jgi:hypothetical protein
MSNTSSKDQWNKLQQADYETAASSPTNHQSFLSRSGFKEYWLTHHRVNTFVEQPSQSASKTQAKRESSSMPRSQA